MGKRIIVLLVFMCTSVNVFSLNNLGIVGKNIFRGSYPLPYSDDYKFLASLGITKIINLEHFLFGNKNASKEAGITIKNHPVKALPWSDCLFGYNELKKAFRSTVTAVEAGEVVYIHCLQGSDRTGALSAALMIRDRSCGDEKIGSQHVKEEVMEALSEYGFHRRIFPVLHQRVAQWAINPPEWICANYSGD